MAKSVIPGPMPAPRDFGWPLKSPDTSHFEILQRDNGQFVVVLNHALLRGVTAEMLTWWFQTFTRLRVTLEDVPGYEGQTVPGYLLWHPSDHFNATLKGKTGPNRVPIAGRTRIHIQEAMQYEVYGWDYPVNTELTVAYVGDDGWAMGRILPLFGPAMMLRIHFRDVVQGGTHLGVHYHYEIVIGVRGKDPLSRFVNRRITHSFGPQFFEAWHMHNVIEVGTFERFLPVLYAQRDVGTELRYTRHHPTISLTAAQVGHDADLVAQRVAAFTRSDDPMATLAYDKRTFL
ncbi:MAG: hypothetical protein AAFQ22_14465 [Pseudomonadota bacterium]